MDHASGVSKRLPYDYLKLITENFSEARKLGSGASGTVYKGVTEDGETMAVKLLFDMLCTDEQFEKELFNLENLQHGNIVKLVGYCNETQREYIKVEGRNIRLEPTKRALCFEYVPNGSLDRHLVDASVGLDWPIRFEIIKGICKGLKYLHEGLQNPMIHLDLKPSNIFLDETMVPKIGDFGISRLSAGKTQNTGSFIGTIGYQPPEFIKKGSITIKFDIFSLGVVIIKLMTGQELYGRIDFMTSAEFLELARGQWRKRLEDKKKYTTDYSEQVRTCMGLAISCVHGDPHERPTMKDIIDKLYALPNDPGSPYIRQDDLSGSYAQGLLPQPAVQCQYRPSGSMKLGFCESDSAASKLFSRPSTSTSSPVSVPSIRTGQVRFPESMVGSVASTSSVGQFADELKSMTVSSAIGQPQQSTRECTVHQDRPGPIPKSMDERRAPRASCPAQLVRMGPCGGVGGKPKEMEMSGVNRISRVVICHGGAVHNISVEYERNNLKEWTDPQDTWGGGRGGRSCSEIILGEEEYLTSIKGRSGIFNKDHLVRELTLFSNKGRKFGPYGKAVGAEFELAAPAYGKILGFHVRAGDLLDAIGTFVLIQMPATSSEEIKKIVRMGPCGGVGGKPKQMDEIAEVNRICKLRIRHDIAVHNISVQFERNNLKEWIDPVETWGGGRGGRLTKIELGPDEDLISVKGRTSLFNKDHLVRQLTFITNKGRTLGPYGQAEGVEFELPAIQYGKIVGFHVRAGDLLDAIGTFVLVEKPATPKSGSS